MPYTMQSARTPRVRGRALRALVALLENGVTRPLIAPRVMRDAGIGALRAAELVEAPTPRPDLSPRATRPGPDPRGTPPGLGPRGETGRSAGGGVAGGSEGAAGAGFAAAADFVAAYEAGHTRPEEVARRVLEAIRAGDDRDAPLRAMVAVREGDVLAQAEAAGARWRRGSPLGPLDGVPVAVKDELDLIGYPTTVGTRFLREPAAEDATVVARLRAAGAVLIGKANMHEIGIDVLGFNPWHGTPRNPYDPGRFTGGSSSGPAAAVAAGLCPLAVAADGGGSIRIPASLCGVFGLKATFGRVSEHGAAPLTWSMAHVGPIAATAADLALGYALMAGPDPRDPITLRQPAPEAAWPEPGEARAPSVAGLRIGVYRPWFEDADAEVVRVCRGLLARLEADGARVVDVEIPDLELCRVAHGVTILSEIATSLERHPDHARQLGLATRLNLALARQLTGRDYVRAQQVRTRMIGHFERAFEAVDVIATPTCARTAPPIRPGALPLGESDLAVTSDLMRFVLPPNLTGHPAMSVPAGYAGSGLPIGMQLIGAPWEEALLLRLAAVTEAYLERRAPAIHFDLLGRSQDAA